MIISCENIIDSNDFLCSRFMDPVSHTPRASSSAWSHLHPLSRGAAKLGWILGVLKVLGLNNNLLEAKVEQSDKSPTEMETGSKAAP